MIIFALMGDKDRFDNLNQFRKAKPSTYTSNSKLMTWEVFKLSASGGEDDAATDGDLDNAYALLLAYKQWGGSYLDEAITLINAIESSEMHTNRRTALGDWDSKSGTNSRSSDWMPGHFRAFYEATGKEFWKGAADTVYALLARRYNNSTGLIADFTYGNNADPDTRTGTQASGGTEEPNGWRYSYNACRDPWRLATDYAHHGTVAAKTQIDKISTWIRGATNNNPENVKDGYDLDGKAFGGYARQCFVAPFAAGMIANSDNQTALNNFYGSGIQGSVSSEDVYDDAIRLLCMLLISGNWWAPYSSGGGPGPIDPPNPPVGGGLDLANGEWGDSAWYEIWDEGKNGSTLKITKQGNPLTANWKLGPEPYDWDTVDDDDIPYVGIGFGDESNDWSNVTEIVIKYTLTNSAYVSLMLPNEKEYFAELPVGNNATITLTKDNFFWDPFEWNKGSEPAGGLKWSNVEGISINALDTYGEQTNLTVTSLIVKGLLIDGEGGVPIIAKTNIRSKTAGVGIVVVQNKINLNIPSEKAVTLKITDVRGRMLLNKNVTLNSGIASIGVPNSISRNQTLILNVEGKNVNVSRKIILR
jgi:endo-1,4-beta-D-glucanase Y